MIVAFSIGSKCAVMLPREFINPQVTPAKGMIINRLIDSRSLILVEEVWQFEGISKGTVEEMCFADGRVKTANWGWFELPNILEKEDDYIVVPAQPDNLMEPKNNVLEAMIKKSVEDFKKVKGFI